MKKITFLAFCALTFSLATAQTDSLEVNTLKVEVWPDGGLQEVQTDYNGSYKTLIYAQNLWIGGMDQSNTLRMSAQTYRQSRVDFHPGPVTTDPNAPTKYNRVYRVSRKTVYEFANGLLSAIPAEIADWPAHGNINFGEASHLAPFVDVNNDGYYIPADGDYPDIKGDEAIYAIFNDSGRIGLEYHLMVYAFNNGGMLDSALFLDYTIYNRSNEHFANVYVGSFTDFDLGNSDDDLTGTNVPANAVFAYNGDSLDDGPFGFGNNPPGCAIRVLKGPPADYFDGVDNDKDGCVDAIWDSTGCISEDPANSIREHYKMTNTMTFYNGLSSAVNSGPTVDMEYYNYLQSIWRDGTAQVVENPSGFLDVNNGDGHSTSGGIPIPVTFPGDTYDTVGAFQPYAPTNWFASPANKYDVRTIISSGPFSIKPDQEFKLSYVINWGMGTDSTQGFGPVNDQLDSIGTIISNIPPNTVGVNYHPLPGYKLYYSQNDKNWVIDNRAGGELQFQLLSVSGQLLKKFNIAAGIQTPVSVDDLSSGIYLLHEVSSGASEKIIVE